jgi:hypothetical protein
VARLRQVHKWLLSERADWLFVVAWLVLAGVAIGRGVWYVAFLQAYIALLLWVNHLRKQAERDAYQRGIVAGQKSVVLARGMKGKL